MYNRVQTVPYKKSSITTFLTTKKTENHLNFQGSCQIDKHPGPAPIWYRCRGEIALNDVNGSG